MKSEYVLLGSVCNINSSKRIFAKEYKSSGIPFYRGKEIIEKHRGHPVSTELFISRERFCEIKEKFGVPQIGDILLTSVGTLGVSWLVNETDFYFKDGNLTWLRCGNRLLSEYLYLWLNSPEAQRQIEAKCIGSTQKALTIETLNKFQIALPSVSEQARICSMLYPILNKIELNQKINENLQQQAFAIFDRLLSNEHLSEYSLSQIATINPKRILKKNEPARCIDMAQLSTSGGFPNGWEVKPYNGGMRFSNGDTLLARITPCLENGKTAYIDFLDENEVAFGSTEYVVISSRGEYPPEFFYCLARCPSFVDYAVKNMNGSSGRQRVSAEAIGNYVLPMLTDDELSEFRSTVPCLFRAMRNNSIENLSLAQLRDALLPKLMSGEIDVTTL